MKVIINADDLGYNDTVNREIFALMTEGVITSATMIPNASGIIEAAAQALQFRQCSFGAHLNLTEGTSLSQNRRLDALIQNSTIHGGARNIRHVWGMQKDFYVELCAQMDRLKSLGIAISHMDSHHHIHTLPYLAPIFKAVQIRYKIRKVRITKNLYPLNERLQLLKRLCKSAYNVLMRFIYSTITTRYFTDVAAFAAHHARLSNTNATIEIMVHPGIEKYRGEVEQLKSILATHDKIKESLINYNHL